KFEWLKIVPPEGSFSVVGKAYIEKSADGKTGRIKENNVNVRAGSTLNAMRTTVQGKLNQGDQVEIIKEEDEYYQIKPPQGIALYVSNKFVDPVREVAIADTSNSAHTSGGVDSSTPSSTTQPSNIIAAAPATQPSAKALASAADFDKAEADFAAASQKPID